VAVGAAVLVGLLLGRQTAVKRFWQRLALKLPVTGRLVRMSLTAQFCRTLGVLLSSGLQLPAALALTRDVMAHEDVRLLIDRLGVAIREGQDFLAPLSASGIFPSLVTSMLRTGAESGLLASSAERLADMYESKLEVALQRLVTVLEPTIILIISAFISLVVISIMSAIMGMYDLTGT
jgi:general secretion pathway protein F